MKQRKYSFSLMEVMVGFSILTIILGMIFSSLYQETILNRRIQKMEREVMSKVEVQQRLDKIFANIRVIDPTSKDRSIYSSGNQKSVFVFFDNGIDPDPSFSGIVKGSVGLDNETFVLKLYQDNKPVRTSILREHVKKIAFEFMTPSSIGVSTIPIWDKTINFMPIYLKITLNSEEEYIFWVNRGCEAIALKGKE